MRSNQEDNVNEFGQPKVGLERSLGVGARKSQIILQNRVNVIWRFQ